MNSVSSVPAGHGDIEAIDADGLTPKTAQFAINDFPVNETTTTPTSSNFPTDAYTQPDGAPSINSNHVRQDHPSEDDPSQYEAVITGTVLDEDTVEVATDYPQGLLGVYNRLNRPVE